MSVLEVRVGSFRVGFLERFEDEDCRFSFDAIWLAAPERPVLGQFFEDRRPRDIVTSGLPCWFAHLLPQGPLRRAISRQTGIDEDDGFELLRILGEDLPGAVVMVPGAPRLPGTRRSRPEEAPIAPGPLRFSLAGAQWKLSVRKGERGLTLPVRGETGEWIAKFHDPSYKDLPRIELATSTWASAAGISLPAFRRAQVDEFVDLPRGIPTGDGNLFLIERFDRGPNGQRIHMEDFAQVIDRPPGDPQYHGRYEYIAAILARVAPADLRPFCERLVFCVLAGNTDAHLKNWSLLYPDGRHPRLSPAYDLVSTVLYAPPIDDELALDLGGSRRFEDVRVDSFRPLAEVCDLPFSEVSGWVQESAARVRAAWQEHAAEWPYLPAERERLEAHLARVQLP
jgi:serine/threonine-protein kinase HipA